VTRRRLALWPALLALSLAAVACGGGGSSTDEAVVFTSREGRFSAEFSSQPERTERTQTVAGIPLKLIFFGTDDEERAVQVGYIDYPPGIVTADPKTSLNGGAEGAAAAVNAPPRNERSRPLRTPPWVLACTDTPAEVAIMAPDSARSCSLGSRVTRAAANEGLWRTATSNAEGYPPPRRVSASTPRGGS